MSNIDTFLGDQDTASGQNTSVVSQPRTSSIEGSQPKTQIIIIDGIRAIGCLAILSSHLNGIVGGSGFWGSLHDDVHGVLTYFTEAIVSYGVSHVSLLFLLSGFLLFLSYAKALLFESPWPELRRFCLRRIFRILPGYYAAIFLMALFFHPELLHISHWRDLWIFLTFCMDYHFSQSFNGPFWTLAIEFQFYLLLPVLVWLFSLIVPRGTLRWRMFKLSLCLLFMAAWGLLVRYWGTSIANTKLDFLIPHPVSLALKPYLFGDTGKYIEIFALGMLLSTVYTYTQYAILGQYWSSWMRRLSPLLLMIGLEIITFMSIWNFYFSYRKYHTYAKHVTFFASYILTIASNHSVEWQPLGYALGYSCCILALLYGSAKLKRPFEGSVLRWVASISYSLYLWHLPLLNMFGTAILPNLRRLGWSPLAEYGAIWVWTLIVIIPISAMLNRWIEQPAMHVGERLIRKLEKSEIQEKANLGHSA